jgi:hypothetical protein
MVEWTTKQGDAIATQFALVKKMPQGGSTLFKKTVESLFEKLTASF